MISSCNAARVRKQTAWRRAMPITPRSGRIDGKCATPTVSARFEFARSTIVFIYDMPPNANPAARNIAK
jgi:hypothetical protein